MTYFDRIIRARTFRFRLNSIGRHFVSKSYLQM